MGPSESTDFRRIRNWRKQAIERERRLMALKK
jgi:hypothetical protein